MACSMHFQMSKFEVVKVDGPTLASTGSCDFFLLKVCGAFYTVENGPVSVNLYADFEEP